MLKRKKIIRILSALVLLALFWLAFFVIQGLFSRQISHHELHIPENSTSVLEIKGEALIKTFVQDVVLEKQLDIGIKDYVNSSESSDPLGVDYLSNFYVFTIERESKELTGVLMNLTNEAQFLQTMKNSLEKGTGFAASDNVGILLFDTEKNPLSSQSLNTYSAKIVATESDFNMGKISASSKDAKANYWIKNYSLNNGKKSFSDVRLALFVEGQQLKIKGDAGFISTEKKNHPVLVKKDLSIQSEIIPNSLNQLWMKNMKNAGFPFPELAYINGNYHYSEPSPIKEMKILPNFDGIYGFEKNFQISIPLIALMASRKITELNLNSFKIGNKTIFYKQINSKTIYLGQSRYNPDPSGENALLEIDGNLRQLLEIRNGGMLERFLAFSPEYNTAERFLSSIKSSNIRAKKKNSDSIDLLGEIIFQDDKSALNETAQLLLKLGFFE